MMNMLSHHAQKTLHIQWLDDKGISHTAEVLPEDICVKDKQEFLVVKTKEGNTSTIRLDKIRFV